jgi:hypothetical protein
MRALEQPNGWRRTRRSASTCHFSFGVRAVYRVLTDMNGVAGGGSIFFAILVAACGPPSAAHRLVVSTIPDAGPPADARPRDVAAQSQTAPDARLGEPEQTGGVVDAREDGPGGGPGLDAKSGAVLDAATEASPTVPPPAAVVDAASTDQSAASNDAMGPLTPPDAPPRMPDRAPPPPEPPTTDCFAAPAPADLISDFERGRPVTVAAPGRGGTDWLPLNAETNTGEVEVTSIIERCSSKLALRFDGSTFAGRVPLVRTAFVNTIRTGEVFYDARAYRGVRLSLRSALPIEIQIKFPDRDTDPVGGVCTGCGDDFGITVVAETEWQTFTVLFSELRQQGNGQAFPALDVTGLSALQIYAPQADGAFDLWIDDVSFMR